MNNTYTKGEERFAIIMMVIFFPFVLLGGLFTAIIMGISHLLEKLGHEWINARDINSMSDYTDGYTLICSPIPCILYLDRANNIAKYIMIFKEK